MSVDGKCQDPHAQMIGGSWGVELRVCRIFGDWGTVSLRFFDLLIVVHSCLMWRVGGQGGYPKAPRLKKFNLTIGFCTNSICVENILFQ